ncbi:hypothetical protein NP233_g5667 [Leucocoprinus birnbaumii]|uniref:Uncharacterized protein n=1 Tax=Leucocoprinus birnbaumii TaxID=56174 RepID=A0AAD5YWH2_9AGAR|nr:hypothetical protein NP233_g5667 [Leucocoprinus birnbaumii]
MSRAQRGRMKRAWGTVSFYHKSFYDFLCDPSRSSRFCTTTLEARGQLFDVRLRRHLALASNYIYHDFTGLALAPHTLRYASIMSWPHLDERVNRFILELAFGFITADILHDCHLRAKYSELVIRSCQFQALRDLNYRKSLIVDISSGRPSLDLGIILGLNLGVDRIIPGTTFSCLGPPAFRQFDAATFLEMVEVLKKHEIISPYDSTFSSKLKSSFTRQPGTTKTSGLFLLGRGDKAIYWYWEYSIELQYFHEFHTVDLVQAMKLYQTEKFEMWEESWTPPGISTSS